MNEIIIQYSIEEALTLYRMISSRISQLNRLAKDGFVKKADLENNKEYVALKQMRFLLFVELTERGVRNFNAD